MAHRQSQQGKDTTVNLRLVVTAGTTDDSVVLVQFENVMALGATLPVPIMSTITLRQLDHYLAEFRDCQGFTLTLTMQDGGDPRLTMRVLTGNDCALEGYLDDGVQPIATVGANDDRTFIVRG
jgi:hypothetical protein